MVQSYLRLLRLSVGLSLLLPVVFVLFRTAGMNGSPSGGLTIEGASIAVGVLGLYGGFHILLNYLSSHVERVSRYQAEHLDRIPSAYLDLAILGAAGLSLFLELTLIRWQGEVFPVFALYKNYSLLACFAGLGLGYALARRGDIPLFLCLPALVFQLFVLLSLRYGLEQWGSPALWQTPFAEQLNMGLGTARSAGDMISIYLFLVVVFTLNTLALIPVGQLCGRLMARRDNLRAYGFNLLGSLLGILLVTLLSFFWTPPAIWFTVCFALILTFQVFSSRVLLYGVLIACFGTVVLSWPVTPGLERLHTPYQLLERGPGERGLIRIHSAGHYYQRVHDLSLANANRTVDSRLERTANYYDLPYQIYGKTPRRVAVVGSGTGNDVAAALRAAAGRVDAIEIDPAILRWGRMYHPERPYDDPRVDAIVNDARTFLRTTNQRYDMIVYGLLDSHTLLSHASSVRLDSFVYTVEGIREARAKLADDGLLALSFGVMSDQIGRKIYLMMKEAFSGSPPVTVRAAYDGSIMYLQTRGGRLAVKGDILAAAGLEDVSGFFTSSEVPVDLSTDDWPFLYMPKRIYPLSYLGMFAVILFLAFGTTWNFIKQKPVFSDISFFFLGAAFMLVETKAITELGLTFGNTWQVISIAISGVLLMAFLANCAVQWFGFKRVGIVFFLLLPSLLVGFLAAKYGGLSSSASGKIGTVLLLTCPMFFSGIVFSALLRRAKDISAVMAMNLLGAMTGGLLEYNSMYFGFRFLYFLAIGLYLLAWVAYYLSHRAGHSPDPTGA